MSFTKLNPCTQCEVSARFQRGAKVQWRSFSLVDEVYDDDGWRRRRRLKEGWKIKVTESDLKIDGPPPLCLNFYVIEKLKKIYYRFSLLSHRINKNVIYTVNWIL